MNRAMTKAERLREMERLYFQRAYSDAEMAERLGVDRATAYRYRIELEREVPIIQLEDQRWTVDRTRYLSSIRVDLAEALSLYLAARRASLQTHVAHAPVASALEKLALTLRQPMTARLVQAADRILAQMQDPIRTAVFETVAQAWSEGRRLRLHYRALRDGADRIHRFAPYLLEPSPWSDGVYLIGESDLARRLITLKLERITHAELLGPFDRPTDFDEELLLHHAWGIWAGEGTPQTVQLKFAPGQATRRLKESIWHPLEQVTDLDDGGCLWQAPIAEWREMVPWIRGWGSQVEILDPPQLRRVVQEDILRLAALYQIGPTRTVPTYQLLWAKTAGREGITHPLICHLIDVAQVAQALWRQVLPAPLKAQIAQILQLEEEETGRLLAFWAGLHDLGKASPGFQRKYAPGQEQLAAVGIPFAKFVATNESCPHATITTATLPDLLVEITQVDKRLAQNVAQALGGHHGNWPPPQETQALKSYQIGDGVWVELRRELVQTLFDLFKPPAVTTNDLDDSISNTLFVLFSGLVSVADWMGSMQAYFPFCDLLPIEPSLYAEQSAAQAQQLLQELNWSDWPAAESVVEFEALFPFPANALQQATCEIAKQANGPSLVIVEAPTGFGKTEAALYLADAWGVRLGQRGVYVAMPTMATSNQMYQRVSAFLARRFGAESVSPLLLHSQAQWQQPQEPPQLHTEDEAAPNAARDMSWFLPKKRSLLAPFGVGTVDQVLLSVLWTRHFFVRLLGLSHKVIIFDEVHAYDTYMSELFQRLLGWLGQLGASVVLLSATLPGRTRQALVEAYTGQPAPDAAAAPYPAITCSSETATEIVALPNIEPRTIALEWCNRDIQAIVAALRDALQSGGCAAVICNTVARAQAIYRELEEAKLVADEDLILFHARFPFAWREATEQKVLSRFGRGEERPERSIVVATQVIEQSLDLDFDFMVTDLAPVDLLIQRAGRLHRHPRATRPAPVSHPRLLLAAADDGGLPSLANDTYVYDVHILHRTFALLAGRDELVLPAMTSCLIDALYNEAPLPDESALLRPLSPALHAQLLATHTEMEQERQKDRAAAQQRLVSPAGERRFLRQRSAGLEEDSPELHTALQALTRLGQPSIQLVCCIEDAEGRLTTPDGQPISLKARPDALQLAALMRASVSVSAYALRQHFTQDVGVPSSWRDHAHLRDHYPVIFCNGSADLAGIGYRLHLTSKLGLEIERLQSPNQNHTPMEEA